VNLKLPHILHDSICNILFTASRTTTTTTTTNNNNNNNNREICPLN